MYEQIAGIRIKGGFFDTVNSFYPLALAKNKDHPKPRFVSIIYGRNGSGKTSLAHAFFEMAHENSIYSQIDFINHENVVIKKEAINKKSIHVFDEEYVKNNISFVEEDGLDCIVIFGERVSLDQEIESLSHEQKKILSQIENARIQLDSYANHSELLSPFYFKDKIRDILRMGWASRELQINNMRKNVSDEFIDDLFTDDKEYEIEILEKDFEKKLKMLKEMQLSEKIPNLKMDLPEDDEAENKILTLLIKKINKPILSEKEKQIMDIIQKADIGERLVQKSREIFKNSSADFCPFCFQKISSEYKNKLVSSISKILDTDEANKHRTELATSKLPYLEINLDCLKKADDELCLDIQKQIEEYNLCIRSINFNIDSKISNVYSPANFIAFGLSERMDQIRAKLSRLKEKCADYNHKIDSISNLQQELSKLNRRLARENIRQFYIQYRKQNNEMISKQNEFANLKMELQKNSEHLSNLEARKKDVHIAVEMINEYLSYIFFSADRLKLEIQKNKYVVICRGTHVALKALSMGERNAIALCYFFSSIFAGMVAKKCYSNEFLIVLDDPISSFDFENKVGIYSFLNLIISELHQNNKNSRFILLTHEIEVMFHFIRVFDHINGATYELTNKSLIDFKNIRHNDYNAMVQQIFCYADMQEGYEKLNHTIGNTMRRVLEAYGTFNYGKGIEGICCDKDIMIGIESERQRCYFSGLMYRLVLHGESHMKERADNILEANFFEFISPQDKVRTAKELLVLLNLLNPLHLKAHLKGTKSEDMAKKITTIKNWEKEMFPDNI